MDAQGRGSGEDAGTLRHLDLAAIDGQGDLLGGGSKRLARSRVGGAAGSGGRGTESHALTALPQRTGQAEQVTQDRAARCCGSQAWQPSRQGSAPRRQHGCALCWARQGSWSQKKPEKSGLLPACLPA